MKRSKDNAQFESMFWAEISPFSATFRDPEREDEFQRHVNVDNASLVLATFLLGLLVWSSFGLLDWLIVTEGRGIVLTIRFVLVLPLGLFFLGLAAFKELYRYTQVFIALICMICGCGIATMTLFMTAPENVYYVSGVIIVLTYLAVIFQTQFLITIGAILVIAGYYGAATYLVSPVTMREAWVIIFFIGTSVMLSMFVRYTQEIRARRDFMRRRLINVYARRTSELLEEAKAAEEAKKKFLSIISHELRTPLNSIIGFSDIIKNESLGPLGSEQYKGFADSINDGGRQLLKIVNDIIHYARAETGKLELNLGTAAIRPFIADCVHQVRAGVADKSLEVNTDIAAEYDTLALTVDTRLLQHAIAHVLDNAVKFSPKQGRITIALSPAEDDTIALAVEDEGPGIDPSEAHRIFNPFEQSDDPLTRGTEGVGIGLPFAKKIFELHGGAVRIERAAEGGARVVMTLPASRTSNETSRAEEMRRAAG